MKKLLCLIGASMLLLTSCSSDDPANQNLILPKKIAMVGENEVILTYNGNKIVQFVNGADKTVFTYTGDLITKEQEFATGSNISSITEYSYENNKLKTSVSTETEGSTTYKSKNVYTHNTDGTVSFKRYSVDVATGVETLSSTNKYTFLNGNVVKAEEGTEYVSVYEYDNKNNLTKNILGFDKLMSSEFSVNNVIKITSTYNGTNPSVITNEFDYNVDGYPTEKRSFYNGTANGTTKYTY